MIQFSRVSQNPRFDFDGGLFLSDKLSDNSYGVIEFTGNGGNQSIEFEVFVYYIHSNENIDTHLPDLVKFTYSLIANGNKFHVDTKHAKNHANKLLKRAKEVFNNWYEDSRIGK
jgi:hypothetical protein